MRVCWRRRAGKLSVRGVGPAAEVCAAAGSGIARQSGWGSVGASGLLSWLVRDPQLSAARQLGAPRNGQPAASHRVALALQPHAALGVCRKHNLFRVQQLAPAPASAADPQLASRTRRGSAAAAAAVACRSRQPEPQAHRDLQTGLSPGVVSCWPAGLFLLAGRPLAWRRCQSSLSTQELSLPL